MMNTETTTDDDVITSKQDWRIYVGDPTIQRAVPVILPDAPNWRNFDGGPPVRRSLTPLMQDGKKGRRDAGETYQASAPEIDMVNAALYLRRPLLITGKPGTGKSSLAYSVARELGFGPVLRWSITSRSTLQQGLYFYDAVGRLQEASLLQSAAPAGSTNSTAPPLVPDIGQFLRLGPLGTALLPSETPRVILIDELDKSDIDLPNDLLNIFEEGEYTIPELQRQSIRAGETPKPVSVLPYDGEDRVEIDRGRVKCREFPFVVITSNGEREFSGPFLRRCLRLTLEPPDRDKLIKILDAHEAYGPADDEKRDIRDKMISAFLQLSTDGELATDQLMNAVFLLTRDVNFGEDFSKSEEKRKRLTQEVLKYLNSATELT